jgi:hypothetical protein
MSPENDHNRLNPTIQKQFIGAREMREITLYPMSVADQLKMTNLIAQAIGAVIEARETVEGMGDIEVVAMAVGFVRENLSQVLELVMDEEELYPDGKPQKPLPVKGQRKKKKDEPTTPKILEELTNTQVTEIATKIYDMNYATAIKNVKSLVERVQGLSLSTRPSQPSASDTDTDSKTSTKSPGEMAA